MGSIIQLLYPKWLAFKRPQIASSKNARWTLIFFVVVGIFFWVSIYQGSSWLCLKCLGIEDIGELLLQKILSMTFLTFFSILIFSNLVTAFTTFFLADDLQFLNTSPIHPVSFFFSRFFETTLHASWMILIFGSPFLLAYGQAFRAPWGFYLQVILVVLPFCWIPSALAIFIALLLATFFPAKRLKDLLVVLSILLFAALYLYFRMLRPERFLDPDNFTQAIDFLAMLRGNSSSFLPSDWAVSAIFPWLSSKVVDHSSTYLVALYLTAISLTIIAFWTFEWLYKEAFSQAQTGRQLKVGRQRFWEALLHWFLAFFPPLSQVVLAKEFRHFLRNPSQWAQLLLLGALVVVYIFNFSSLRQLSSLELHGISALIANFGIFVFNLILLGFVISAVAVRFAFPAVSLEGRSFWIIRQSPLTMKQFLTLKFWSIFLPLVILAQTISVTTNFFIHSNPFYLLAASFIVLLMTIGITGLGIGLGALYPRFEIDNPAKIATGFGGVLYMILAVVWILFLLLLTLLPIRHLFWSQAQGVPLTFFQQMQILLCVVIGIVATYFSYRIPMNLGANALENRE